jgi:hypothetical protein
MEELKMNATIENLTVTEYARKLLFPNQPQDPTINVLIEEVLKCAATLEIGENFSLPDCFPQTRWGKLSKRTRQSLGKKFKKLVDDNQIAGVVYVGQNKNDWATYKKV